MPKQFCKKKNIRGLILAEFKIYFTATVIKKDGLIGHWSIMKSQEIDLQKVQDGELGKHYSYCIPGSYENYK